jgi:hypothetical protein
MPKPQQGSARKATKPLAGKQSARATTAHQGDQIAAKPPASKRALGATRRRGGYVRMRIRMDDGVMSIVDTHHVDSELALPTRLLGSNAYDVTLGDRLLHADSIPDVGVSRSFANPDPNAPPEQRGHHFHELSMYEFDVRVPVGDLTKADLPKVAITYYRVKEHVDTPLAAVPLATQYDKEMREVSRIVGLPDSVL